MLTTAEFLSPEEFDAVEEEDNSRSEVEAVEVDVCFRVLPILRSKRTFPKALN
jgi:hypothetical protein